MKYINKKRSLVPLLVLLPIPALADTGVPMISLTFPAMLILLIPIILVEALFARKYLSISFVRSLVSQGVANTVSTVAGLPLTWFVLMELQMHTGGGRAYGLDSPIRKILAVTWQAPWLVPYEKDLFWMIPVAALVLLVPFFFVSWIVESLVAKPILRDVPSSSVWKMSLRANGISYGLLTVGTAIWLLVSEYSQNHH